MLTEKQTFAQHKIFWERTLVIDTAVKSLWIRSCKGIFTDIPYVPVCEIAVS